MPSTHCHHQWSIWDVFSGIGFYGPYVRLVTFVQIANGEATDNYPFFIHHWTPEGDDGIMTVL